MKTQNKYLYLFCFICNKLENLLNMENIYKLLLSLAFLVISQGAISQDFEVAPVRVTFSVAPGESQSKVVTVKNHSNKKETITLRMQDYLIQRHGKMEILPAGSTKNSIANWINLNPTFVELQPNESRTIQVNLQSPVDDFTAKWGILSFVTAAEQTVFSADRELQTGLSVAGRIDIFVTYNPTSGDIGNIEIGNFQELPSDKPDVRLFSVNIDNPGEKILISKLYLIASNMRTGEEHKFKTVEVTLYPQSARTVEVSMPKTLPPGKYALAAILDYPGSTSLKGAQIIIDVE